MIPLERDRLSARENEVFGLAIDGKTDIQIALRLDITQSTVNSYWVRIRGKLGQLSRTELVALALKEQARAEMADMTAQRDALQDAAHDQAQLASDFANVEIYRAALDAMPEAVLIVCHRAVIRYANARVEAMFGYAKDDLVGQPVSILVPKSIAEREHGKMTSYMHSPYPVRIGIDHAVYAQRRDGSQFRVLLLIDHRPTTAGPIFSCLVRDFTSEIDNRRRFVSAEI